MAWSIRGLDELVTVSRADVYKAGRRAAILMRRGDDIVFSYVAGWDGPAVASTLPVSDEPVVSRAGAVPAFFAGQLPEGRRLTALQRAVKTSADDELTLLLAVGSDVVGDVQVVPEGTAPAAEPAVFRLESAEDVVFADLVRELDVRVDRVGVAGVQDKVSAAMITLPVHASGGRAEHILKLNPPEFPQLVENEAFFLDAARRSGLAVADASVLRDTAGQPGLLVRRFDRVSTTDGLLALAVEDGCQVLDRHPAAKYRLTTEETLGGLSRLCGAPVVAARAFLAQVAFAFLTGNGDAHAKNFSVLRGPTGEWEPAPAYDLPSSYPYGDTTMAMSIGVRRDAMLPNGAFVELGKGLGVPERAGRKMLAEIAERADLWLPDLDRLPFGAGVIKMFRRIVEARRRILVA